MNYAIWLAKSIEGDHWLWTYKFPAFSRDSPTKSGKISWLFPKIVYPIIDLKGQVVLNLCILNINFTGIFYSYSTVVVPTLDRGMTVCCSFFVFESTYKNKNKTDTTSFGGATLIPIITKL